MPPRRTIPARERAGLKTIVLSLPLLAGAGAREAAAIPLFARQTGQQCAACHTAFPELTPYGRLFKLNGYTFGGGQSNIPPIAVMMATSFTNTQKPVPKAEETPYFGTNNNFAYDFASIFYGGVLLPHVGMFGQITWDNIGKNLSWDNTDLRFADAVKIGGVETIFGISVNNNPTVQDVWNSVPAWGFPYIASGLAPTPAAATLLEGALAQQVVGVTAYTYWNRLIYVEAGGYRSLGNTLLYQLGANPGPPVIIKGVAPYWRVALEPKWGPNSWEFGTFGMEGAFVPNDITGYGTDHIVDIGVDTQYQWLTDAHAITVQGYLIHEMSHNGTSFQQGLVANGQNDLTSIHAKISYYYQQTYGATFGYFHVDGTKDAVLYGAAPVFGSGNGKPNSDGFITELDYMPFNHGGPAFWPWLNLKLGLQYIWYTNFNGTGTNYDGSGRAASDNNTVYAFAWLAF